MIRLSLCLALLALGPARAGDVRSERLWTGTNGKSLRGTFVRGIDDGAKVEIATNDGRFVTIAVENLSEADRKLVATALAPPPAAAEPLPAGSDPREARQSGTGAFAAFKPEPAADRSKIPVIDQGEFGIKASDCVPSSFCNFLLWWDQTGYLEIPKRGDFDDKAQWVHSKLARYCGTRNTAGTSFDDAREGFMKYFERELGDTARMRLVADNNLSPANLARHTRGNDATLLEMTLRRPPAHDSSHWVALVDAQPDGSVVFNTWGARFEGKVKVLQRRSQTVPATTYEIEITNRASLPDWVRDQEIRMILDPAKRDAVIKVRAYRFREEGKPAPLPPDPEMGP